MKKFLVMLMSVLMALVMCFSFVACGGNPDNTGGNGPDPEKPGGTTDPGNTDDPDDKPNINVAQKLSEAFANLYTVNGYTGEIKLTSSVATDAEATETDTVSFEKRGDRVKLVLPAMDKDEPAEKGEDNTSGALTSEAQAGAAETQEYIFDLGTGYLYKATDAGYTFSQPVPQGTLDYMLALIDANKQGNAATFGGSYDNATRTATETFDLTADANKFLTPIYETYTGGSLVDLIDKYIDAYVTDPTIGSLNDAIGKFEFFVTTAKDSTVGFVIDFFKTTYGVDVIEELAGMGVTLTSEQVTALKARTVGEMAVGICNYVDATVQAIIDMIANSGSGSDAPSGPSQTVALAVEEDGDGTGETGSTGSESGLDPAEIMEMVGMIKEIATEQIGMLVNCAFFAEIPEEMYTTDSQNEKVIDGEKLAARIGETAEVLTGALGTVSVKSLIDNIPDETIGFMIENEIELTTLKWEYALTFDQDYNIEKLVINYDFSHNYTVQAQDEGDEDTAQTPYLFANNGFNSRIEISFGSYTATDSTFDVTLKPDLPPVDVKTIVFDEITEDVVVYLETSESALPKAEVIAELIGEDEAGTELTIAEGDIVFDDAKKTVTVKAAFINEALKTAAPSDYIVISLFSEGESVPTFISIIPLSTDAEELQQIIENALARAYGFVSDMIGGEGNDSDNTESNTGNVGGENVDNEAA